MMPATSEGCLLCRGQVGTVLDRVYDTRFGIPDEYRIAGCSQCGLEQTRPIPSQLDLKTLYEQHYNFSGEANTRYTRLRAAFHRSRLYSLFVIFDGDISFHSRKGTGRLLDVGCNEGRGLGLYREHGFQAEGLELNSRAAAAARAAGFTVYEETLEQFHPEEPYRHIVLSNVLEHTLDPAGMLGHVRRLLAPNGRVYISCPNRKSWLRDIFGRAWINWHVPFHISHFSHDDLATLLRPPEWNVVEQRQETPALWVAHSIIASLFFRRGQVNHRLRSPILVPGLMAMVRGLGFPLLWLGNRLGRGDCLIVVAERQG
jgi:SAM-dependent methyltransferase